MKGGHVNKVELEIEVLGKRRELSLGPRQHLRVHTFKSFTMHQVLSHTFSTYLIITDTLSGSTNSSHFTNGKVKAQRH